MPIKNRGCPDSDEAISEAPSWFLVPDMTGVVVLIVIVLLLTFLGLPKGEGGEAFSLTLTPYSKSLGQHPNQPGLQNP